MRNIPVLMTILLFLFVSGCRDLERKSYRADRGVLDLRDHDFSRDGEIALDGQWEFFWQGLYSGADFENGYEGKVIGVIEVPSLWTSHKYARSYLPVEGFATYHLRFMVSDDGAKLALRIPAMDSLCRIYVNNRILFENGSFEGDKFRLKPEYYAPVVVDLEPAPVIDLYVQMINYHYPRPGMRDSIVLGRDDLLRRTAEKDLALDIFLIGAIFLMAMYHLGLFYLRRSDHSPLHFSLLCVFALLRLLVTGEGYAYRVAWFNWQLGTALEYITFYGCVATCALYIRSLYPQEVLRKVVWAVIAVCGIFAMLVLVTPVMVYARTLVYFDVFTGIMIVYILVALINAVRRKRESALIFTVGTVILFGTVINDLLYNFRFVHSAYLMPYGLYSFFFVQSFLLSSKFSRAFTAVEDLSRDLEDKVAGRTKELELERNKLEHRNLMMEREIELARRIQRQLIPRVSPVPYISAVYRPMMRVGGDFYDFVRFDDPDKIGIFLSDVSGHGISAAFITSMIKSIMLQAGPHKENPAEMLMYLNEILFNHTAGNFCTVFYGIFNKNDNSITYANAGHDRPLVIGKDGIREFEGHRSVPVGMFSNDELLSENRACSNTTEYLQAGRIIVLYTDGLTETRPTSNSNEFFQERRMPEVLERLAGCSAEEYCSGLYKALCAFRGSDQFEDDVCIICLEV